MSELDRTRALLIELETAQLQDQEALDAARANADEAQRLIMYHDEAVAERRALIAQTRRDLVASEARAAARERAHEVDEDVERLSARFRKAAEGFPWYAGTGQDDPIMAHQWQAVQFGAVAGRWICGDGVGLGKTREAVGFLDLVKAKKIIVVCEANICNQFAGEIMELAPHRELFNLYKKLPAKRHELLDMLLSKTEAIVVVNYEIWRRDHDCLRKLIEWHADTVIVDEAHNLKTTSTANFKYVKTLISVDNTCPSCKGHIFGLLQEAENKKRIPKPCPTCGWKKGDKTPIRTANKLEELLLTRSVKNLCLTTGTPILNEPGDLFALLTLCNPILFPTRKGFDTAFLTNNHFSGKWEWRPGALETLKPLIGGLFLSRTLEEIGIKLPEQHVNVIPVELDPKEYRKQFRTIRQITETAQIILDSGEEMSIMHLIALITRKRQANVWPGGIKIIDTRKESPTFGEVLFDAGTEIDESVKLDEIEENIVAHLPARQIVFSQFKTALSEFEVRLKNRGLRVVRFDGDTPEKLRQEVKTNFDLKLGEEPKWDVVLANYKTGGTGLNFTAATVTHVLDEEWNPGKRNQGYGRTKRIGQTQETFVYVYRIPGTIDTWMSNLIRHKERLIEGFEETMTEGIANDLREGMRTGAIL